MSSGPKKTDAKQLRETLKENPADWETRKQLAHVLYDEGSFLDAANIVWAADEIPSIDVELAFAARILAKAAPRKAIRLLTALLENNKGKAVQNLGLANALLHHGMVLQAARFYGAALEADPTVGNPDLEHFILWIDDEETLWGNFQNRRPVLGELPWMKRDPMEALKLTSRISTHTTPIKLPSLKAATGEELGNDLYQQKAEKGADPTPPPSVTIPLDRVAPKDRLFDEKLGAPTTASTPELPGLDTPATTAAAAPVKREIAKPNFGAASSTPTAKLPAKETAIGDEEPPQEPEPPAKKEASGAVLTPPPGGAVLTPPPSGAVLTPPPGKPAPPKKPAIPPKRVKPGEKADPLEDFPADLPEDLEPDPAATATPTKPKPPLPPIKAGPPTIALKPGAPTVPLAAAATPTSRPKPALPPLKKPDAAT